MVGELHESRDRDVVRLVRLQPRREDPVGIDTRSEALEATESLEADIEHVSSNGPDPVPDAVSAEVAEVVADVADESETPAGRSWPVADGRLLVGALVIGLLVALVLTSTA